MTRATRMMSLLRRRMRKARSVGKWIRQGRPRFLPVVIAPGKITKCRHGYALVENWSWDFSFQQNGPIDIGHAVDILGAQYGVDRVKELECCPACQSVVTA